MSVYFSVTGNDDLDWWVPCDTGPWFIHGYPCCAGHARARAESGDLGWWTNTTHPALSTLSEQSGVCEFCLESISAHSAAELKSCAVDLEETSTNGRL